MGKDIVKKEEEDLFLRDKFAEVHFLLVLLILKSLLKYIFYDTHL
jgi:hypothetical protein